MVNCLALVNKFRGTAELHGFLKAVELRLRTEITEYVVRSDFFMKGKYTNEYGHVYARVILDASRALVYLGSHSEQSKPIDCVLLDINCSEGIPKITQMVAHSECFRSNAFLQLLKDYCTTLGVPVHLHGLFTEKIHLPNALSHSFLDKK